MITTISKYRHHIDTALLLRVTIFTFVLGLFAHAFCFANYSIGLDAIGAITSTIENFQVQWKVILGRFVQPLNFLFRGATTSPWLLGLLALCWFSLANYFIIKLFDIKSRWIQLAICGLTCTHFSTSILYANYIHEADTYALAFFLSVLAIYTFKHCKQGFWLAPLFIFLSLGLYQCYFAASTSAMMLVVLKKITEEQSFRKNIIFAAKALSILLLGLILYYGFVCAYIDILGIETKAGNNDVTMLKLPALADIPKQIWETYTVLSQHLLTKPYLTIPIQLSNGIILISIIYLAIKWCRQSTTSKQNKALFIAILLLLPFAINLLYFLTGWRMHDLMMHPHIFIYITLYFLAQISPSTGRFHQNMRALFIFASFWIIGSNIITANQIYLFKNITHQRDLIVFNKITSEIEQQAGYRVGETPVLFIGEMHKNAYTMYPQGFTNLENFRLFSRFKNSNLTHGGSVHAFAQNLSYPIRPGATADAAAFSKRLDVTAMPCFPQKGYCQMINGRAVVKLSNGTKN